MADCKFADTGESRPGCETTLKRCTECGREHCLPYDVRATCGRPNLAQRAANFATAAVQHVAAGAPQASDALIQARLKGHCVHCPYYTGRSCSHPKCGCAINAVNSSVQLNKLAWRDQACPDRRWPAIASDEREGEFLAAALPTIVDPIARDAIERRTEELVGSRQRAVGS